MIADRDARLNRCEKTIGASKLKVKMKSSNCLNFKLQIQGSHLTILAYEAWLGTGPSAITGSVTATKLRPQQMMF